MTDDIHRMTQEKLKELIQNQGRTNAEVAAANSPEKIAAAVAEFERLTGHKDDPSDPWAGTEIASIAKSRNVVITPQAIVEAYEIRQASRLPQQDLKRVIQERERERG